MQAVIYDSNKILLKVQNRKMNLQKRISLTMLGSPNDLHSVTHVFKI